MVRQPSPAVDREDLERQLAERLTATAIRMRIPGVGVGIEFEGRQTFAYHGVTALENPLPVDPRTLFQIGSNTKTFTATALMRLVEDGAVDLGAPVIRYLPELRLRDRTVRRRVTVLQLLNHTAGWAGDFFIDTGHGDDALARYVDSLDTLAQESPPGAHVSYNNAAFCVAGRVIEKVTGLVYEEAIRRLVIAPLALRDTVFPPADVLTRRYAAGHLALPHGVETARRWLLPRGLNAAGTLCSTPGDMLRYARFHMGDGRSERVAGAPAGRVLRRRSLQLMQQPTIRCPNHGLGDCIGISWLLRDVGPARLVGHGGGTNGQISAFQMVPERRFAIVVLTNASNGGQLAGEIQEWALERWLGMQPSRPAKLDLGAEALRDYAGVYANQATTFRVDPGPATGTLTVTPEPTPAGLEWTRAFSGEQADKLGEHAYDIEVLDGDRFRVVGLPPRPAGAFLRRGGRVIGFVPGGRLALRLDAEGLQRRGRAGTPRAGGSVKNPVGVTPAHLE